MPSFWSGPCCGISPPRKKIPDNRLRGMSIRMIALDLYRLQKEIDHLEKQIAAASPQQASLLKDKLRKVKAEHQQMRRVLDGRLDRPERPLR